MPDTHPLPTLRFEAGSKVVPGDRIGTVQQVIPGVGTYARGGNVYASLLGKLELHPSSPSSSPGAAESNNKSKTTTTATTAATTVAQFSVSVKPEGIIASRQVIRVGQMVLCRVVRVGAPQATVEIIATEGIGNLQTPVEASIPREEAVKSGTTNREIHECFQPTDIVLAKVLSLGDARRYLLTTAEADLGVIYAICYSSKKPMIPCSWKEMECPDTGVREPRKCAKPRKVLLPSSLSNNNTTTTATTTSEKMDVDQPVDQDKA